MDQRQIAMKGQWGANEVLYGEQQLKQVDYVRQRYEMIHKFQDRPPENFVA